MPKFAVYYVPQANEPIYKYGLQILGYDVRARETVQMSEELRNQFGEFDENWAKEARPYGFHVTIGDTIDFSLGDLLLIEREIEDLLNCFDSNHPFTLHQHQNDFVTVWGKQKEIVVLRYDPNEHLKTFHHLVVARVHTLGTGSVYVERYLKDPNQYKLYQQHKIRKFYSPTALSDYRPHFTLLNPYTGENHDQLEKVLSTIFGGFQDITISTICLLVQRHESEPWQIYREFNRASYPESSFLN